MYACMYQQLHTDLLGWWVVDISGGTHGDAGSTWKLLRICLHVYNELLDQSVHSGDQHLRGAAPAHLGIDEPVVVAVFSRLPVVSIHIPQKRE